MNFLRLMLCMLLGTILSGGLSFVWWYFISTNYPVNNSEIINITTEFKAIMSGLIGLVTGVISGLIIGSIGGTDIFGKTRLIVFSSLISFFVPLILFSLLGGDGLKNIFKFPKDMSFSILGQLAIGGLVGFIISLTSESIANANKHTYKSKS